MRLCRSCVSSGGMGTISTMIVARSWSVASCCIRCSILLAVKMVQLLLPENPRGSLPFLVLVLDTSVHSVWMFMVHSIGVFFPALRMLHNSGIQCSMLTMFPACIAFGNRVLSTSCAIMCTSVVICKSCFQCSVASASIPTPEQSERCIVI